MHPGVFLLPLTLISAEPSQRSTPSLTIAEKVFVVADRFALQEDRSDKILALSRTDIENRTSSTLDDALRQLSGFQLFRRSSSRTANPTSQGSSLRGIGSSGASRALVLYDGIPLNDPFGGWIYWGRIPEKSLEAIELFRGGGSDLFGNNAVGGIVNLVRSDSKQPYIDFEATGGNQGTSDFSLGASANFHETSWQLFAENYSSDGYVLLSPEIRGEVDHPAGSTYKILELSATNQRDSAARIFVRGTYYDEDRNNGTDLQTNSTIFRQVASGLNWSNNQFGTINSRFYGSTQDFNQQFSIVSESRDSESLASIQKVKSEQLGFTADWLSVPLGSHILQAGLDAQTVRGQVGELMPDPEGNQQVNGGRQTLFGLFFQDRISLWNRFEITASARFDGWKNSENPGTSSRSKSAWSPKISFRYLASSQMQISIAWYRAFRAPTLNELYRPFRLGNTLTLPNPDLGPEKSNGFDTTISYSPASFLSLRGTAFVKDVDQSITNRTLIFDETQIVRRRENLGKIRAKGIEIESRTEINPSTRTALRYQYANSRIVQSTAPTLKGLQTAQVPSHLVSFGLERQWTSRLLSNLEGRYSSSQFEDDLNRFLLDDYFTLNLILKYQLTDSLEVFASCENVLNQKYELGFIPFPTFGPPRLVQFGIRFQKGR